MATAPDAVQALAPRTPKVRPATYTRVQVALHWLVVALLLEQYGTSGAIVRTHTIHMIGQRQNPTDLVLHVMHNRLGLLLTGLVVIRLAYRLWAGAPVPAAGGTLVWTQRAADLVHAGFYVVLICEGIAGAVASYLWWPMSVLHVALFKALLGLIIVHVVAVVWHQLTGEAMLGRMGFGWIPSFRMPSRHRAPASDPGRHV